MEEHAARSAGDFAESQQASVQRRAAFCRGRMVAMTTPSTVEERLACRSSAAAWAGAGEDDDAPIVCVVNTAHVCWSRGQRADAGGRRSAHDCQCGAVGKKEKAKSECWGV